MSTPSLKTKINRYRFSWLTGDTTEYEGETPEQALTLAGYGQGAVPALDYWEQITTGSPGRNK